MGSRQLLHPRPTRIVGQIVRQIEGMVAQGGLGIKIFVSEVQPPAFCGDKSFLLLWKHQNCGSSPG